MDNIREVEVTTIAGTEMHITIDHGNEQFTSMLKSTYDEQQAALSTPIVSGDE